MKMDFSSMTNDKAFRIACWFIVDDCDCDIDRAVELIVGAKDNPHRGDCTQEPFTCVRCCYEDSVKLADKIRPVIEGE